MHTHTYPGRERPRPAGHRAAVPAAGHRPKGSGRHVPLPPHREVPEYSIVWCRIV